MPEAAHPYYILSPHFKIEAASPKGGLAPVDPDSVKTFTDEESTKFLHEPTSKKLYSETKKIRDVNVADYAAIYVVGGVSR